MLQAATPRPQRTILEPGRNCWRIAQATRAAVLIDGEAYYRCLDYVLRRAERSILIVGWDFDGRIKLCPSDTNCLALGPLFRDLVERKPELEIRILIWSVAVIHAPSAPDQLLLGGDWEKHPRISVRLDTQHPIYAAHHQKLVCVDENIAFSGGMDLTVERWDSCDHRVRDPLRINQAGKPYDAVHDVQMMVEGDAARVIGDVIRERWARFNGAASERRSAEHDLWPSDIDPDFSDVGIAVARTYPAWGEFPAVNEIANLTDDAVRAARRLIYIENQYLTSPRLAKNLARRLAQSTGPDIVIVVTKESHGAVEEFVMGRNRKRLIRRLRRADKYGRLRIYYPVVRDDGHDCSINIHAKLMIVDDTFLRVGSANLNNRSMGLDTECDLVVEGSDKHVREQIRRLRERLLAEHLQSEPDHVGDALRAVHSMIVGIENLNRGKRQLREVPNISRRGPVGPVFGTFLLDPIRPILPRWITRWRTRAKSIGLAGGSKRELGNAEHGKPERKRDEIINDSKHD